MNQYIVLKTAALTFRVMDAESIEELEVMLDAKADKRVGRGPTFQVIEVTADVGIINMYWEEWGK